jgi:hypothetical protein
MKMYCAVRSSKKWPDLRHNRTRPPARTYAKLDASQNPEWTRKQSTDVILRKAGWAARLSNNYSREQQPNDTDYPDRSKAGCQKTHSAVFESLKGEIIVHDGLRQASTADSPQRSEDGMVG